MSTPDLDYRTRYEIVPDANGNGVLVPDTTRARHPFMDFLADNSFSRVARQLSNVAKTKPDGEPQQGYNGKLPPIEITTELIRRQQQQVPTATGVPFKLAAVGFVDVGRVMRHEPGLVSNNVKIVP